MSLISSVAATLDKLRVYALQLFVVDVSGTSYQPPGGLGADSWCLISTQNSLNYILSHDITLWDYIFFLCFLTRQKYSSAEILALGLLTYAMKKQIYQCHCRGVSSKFIQYWELNFVPWDQLKFLKMECVLTVFSSSDPQSWSWIIRQSLSGV